METFSALLALRAGNSPASGEFPAQRPVTRSFDVFFDLCLNKQLRKQSRGWWFETLSRPLWRRCDDLSVTEASSNDPEEYGQRDHMNPLGTHITTTAKQTTRIPRAYFMGYTKKYVNVYRQFSNIRRTQSQNINVSRLVLLLYLPNPLKPGVKLRMKM